MPDVYKTMNGLECCIRMISSNITCEEIKCPYYSKHDQTKLNCWKNLNRDALNLIRTAYGGNGNLNDIEIRKPQR